LLLSFFASSAPGSYRKVAAFLAPTHALEKSFQLFLRIAKIAARAAKFLMDDRSFAAVLVSDFRFAALG
jgi:hypothetical protein